MRAAALKAAACRASVVAEGGFEEFWLAPGGVVGDMAVVVDGLVAGTGQLSE